MSGGARGVRWAGRAGARAAAASAAALAVALGAAAPDAAAHASLVRSDPAAGATLGAAPAAVRLTFSEAPEPSLSDVQVVGPAGAAAAGGPARPAPGDPRALVVPLRTTGRGVYTVQWRSVSAVDGHASRGTFAFGVGVAPGRAAVQSAVADSSASGLEIAARWLFLTGLVLLIGAAAAAVGRFGGPGRSALALGAGGWAAAATGLLLLGAAQRQAAGSSVGDLLGTPVGAALVWRAAALAVAGGALLAVWRSPARQRAGLGVAGLAALAAAIVHAANGHAAAGPWPHALTVAAQAAHLAAAGIWLGGLAALLLGTRGAASAEKAAHVRRFGVAAAAGLAAVVVTGTLRTADELSAWSDLAGTGYGRAISVKILLLAGIAALAWRNRRRHVPAAGTDLRPLRRTSRAELGLAAAALAAAAVLGALAPPVSGQRSGPPGLSASGADFGTTVRVKLSAPSDQPGPNRFTFRVRDYDSGDPVTGASVRLRFTPLDDPGVAATTLALRDTGGGTYAGTGANLAFDGRWRIVALVQRGAGATTVPLSVDVAGPKHFVSVQRTPGQPPKYTMQLGNFGADGYIYISPRPARPGPSVLTVIVLGAIESEEPVTSIVVTVHPPDGPLRVAPTRRRGPGTFVAPVRLAAGRNEIAVTAHSPDGARRRGVFDVVTPGG